MNKKNLTSVKMIVGLPILVAIGLAVFPAEAATFRWDDRSDRRFRKNFIRNDPVYEFNDFEDLAKKKANVFGEFTLSGAKRNERWEITVRAINGLPDDPSQVKGKIELFQILPKNQRRELRKPQFFNWKKDEVTTIVVDDGTYRIAATNLQKRGRKFEFQARTVPEPFSTTAAVGLAIAGVARTLKKKKTEDA